MHGTCTLPTASLKYDKLVEQNCSWEINVAYPYIHKFTSLVRTNVRMNFLYCNATNQQNFDNP